MRRTFAQLVNNVVLLEAVDAFVERRNLILETRDGLSVYTHFFIAAGV